MGEEGPSKKIKADDEEVENPSFDEELSAAWKCIQNGDHEEVMKDWDRRELLTIPFAGTTILRVSLVYKMEAFLKHVFEQKEDDYYFSSGTVNSLFDEIDPKMENVLFLYDVGFPQWRLMVHATETNNVNMLSELHKKGADLDVEDDWGRCLLTIAAGQKAKEAFDYLVDNGANVMVSSNPLHLITDQYYWDRMIEKGVPVNISTEMKDVAGMCVKTPMWCAQRNKNEEQIAYLARHIHLSRY